MQSKNPFGDFVAKMLFVGIIVAIWWALKQVFYFMEGVSMFEAFAFVALWKVLDQDL